MKWGDKVGKNFGSCSRRSDAATQRHRRLLFSQSHRHAEGWLPARTSSGGALCKVRGARCEVREAQRKSRSAPRDLLPKRRMDSAAQKISFVEQKQVAAAHRPVRRFLSVGRRRRGHGGRSQGSTLLACRQNTSLFAIDSKQAIICVKRNGERKLDEFVETRIVGSASVYPVRLAHQRCAIRRIALGDVATFLLSLVDGLSRGDGRARTLSPRGRFPRHPPRTSDVPGRERLISTQRGPIAAGVANVSLSFVMLLIILLPHSMDGVEDVNALCAWLHSVHRVPGSRTSCPSSRTCCSFILGHISLPRNLLGSFATSQRCDAVQRTLARTHAPHSLLGAGAGVERSPLMCTNVIVKRDTQRMPDCHAACPHLTLPLYSTVHRTPAPYFLSGRRARTLCPTRHISWALILSVSS